MERLRNEWTEKFFYEKKWVILSGSFSWFFLIQKSLPLEKTERNHSFSLKQKQGGRHCSSIQHSNVVTDCDGNALLYTEHLSTTPHYLTRATSKAKMTSFLHGNKSLAIPRGPQGHRSTVLLCWFSAGMHNSPGKPLEVSFTIIQSHAILTAVRSC